MNKDDPSTEAAYALLARREVAERVCRVCGKQFNGLRSARYCSQACRQRAYIARHRKPTPNGTVAEEA